MNIIPAISTSTLGRVLPRAICVAMALLLIFVESLPAATFTWDGGGTNDFMNTAANWNPNVAPPFDGTDDLVFAGTVRSTPFVLGTNWSVISIAFDDTAGQFTVNGNPWHVLGGGVSNSSSQPQALNNIYVDASQTWNAASESIIAYDLYASGAARTITFSGGFDTAIFGGIDNGSGSTSALGLTKTGSGTLSLAGNSAKRLGGAISVEDGALEVSGHPTSGAALVEVDGNITIGTQGVAGQNAVLTALADPGLAITQIPRGFISIGGVPVSPATGIIVGANVDSRGTLNVSNANIVETGAGGLTVHTTGTVNLGNPQYATQSPGTLRTYGNVLIDGGTFNQLTNGSFVPYANTSFTVQNGGHAHFDSAFTFNNGRSATVTGAGSVLESAEGFVVDTGSLFVQNGGAVSAASYLDVGRNADGALNVDGPGSLLYAAGGVPSVWGTNGHEADIIIDHQANVQYAGGLSLVSGTGLVYANVNHGAQLSTGPMLSLNAGDSGSISFLQLGQPALDASGAMVKIDPNGQLIIGTSFIHYNGTPSSISVFPGASLIVGSGGTTHLNKSGVLVLDGGIVDLQNLPVYDGLLSFDSGSLSYLGYLDIGATSPAAIRALGAGSQKLASNRSLTISQGTFVHAGYTLTLDGGALSTSFVYNDHYSSLYGAFVFNSGALTITGPDGLVIGPDNTGLAQLGSGFDVSAGKTLRVTHTLTVVDGGSLVLFEGAITAGALVNNNVFNCYGGTLSTGGLTNNGRMYFLNGTDNQGDVSSGTDVHGSVVNNSTTLGIAVGHNGTNGNVTFWGDVANIAHSLFVVSPGSVARFNGGYSGDGISGGGEMHFAGPLNPGVGPASITLAGDVTFEPTAALQIELGGTNPESDVDHVAVVGHLTIDGGLNISLVNGFMPSAGDSFDILDWNTLSGTFSEISLPGLLSGLAWNTSDLYSGGVIRVVPGVPGDYDNNGAVDAADYLTWRKTVGQSGVGLAADGSGNGSVGSEDYEIWRQNFAAPAASGAIATASVPEPGVATLVAVAIPCMFARRRRSGD